jgi:hypothetical protein
MAMATRGHSRIEARLKRPSPLALAAWLGLAAMIGATARAGDGVERDAFPTVPSGHTHVRLLLQDAMRYVAEGSGMVDKVSGYPFEGWNEDHPNGVFLRSFTQLTAIGQYLELMANVVAGQADSPGLSREQAQAHLGRLVASLRQDQRDPTLAWKGLLVNFLDLATGKRLGPLASEIEKHTVLDAFGRDKGEALWKALAAKGWIVPRDRDRVAEIRRGAKFGSSFFDGHLAPFADKATNKKVMDLLDRRVVLVVFGDNSNLSTSVAKAIGALLLPEVADRPEVAGIRGELGRFLDDQKEGYARLYDAKAGLFYFGYDVTRDRLFGWEDLSGNWTTGHMDYFVNEFRGPATFVAARFGMPAESIGNLGFKIKPYRLREGREVYVLAPWEGSAFQALGLGLSLRELDTPSWRALLGDAVDVEIDYAARKGLPGFLSESYTGDGARYTGDVGIPEIAVAPRPRITAAASLYCLGVAHAIAPEKVERFLAANWPTISTLLTDHGPWEGYNVTRREPIRFQTSAHTLALIHGLLGTGPAHMRRYADHAGLRARLDAFFPPGDSADLLAEGTDVFAWANKGVTLHSSRDGRAFRARGDRVNQLGIAFVSTRKEGVNLSGGLLTLRYRNAGPLTPVLIALKPAGNSPASAGLIPKEITTHFDDTGGREGEIRVMLPATVGLTAIKEVVITHDTKSDPRAIDLTVTRLDFTPAPARP